MYKIGDKVVIKRNGRFGYIIETTMGDNSQYLVYRERSGASWYTENEIKPYVLSDEEAWQYIQGHVTDESAFEDDLKSDERERLKNLMIKAFNAGMSYR